MLKVWAPDGPLACEARRLFPWPTKCAKRVLADNDVCATTIQRLHADRVIALHRTDTTGSLIPNEPAMIDAVLRLWSGKEQSRVGDGVGQHGFYERIFSLSIQSHVGTQTVDLPLPG